MYVRMWSRSSGGRERRLGGAIVSEDSLSNEYFVRIGWLSGFAWFDDFDGVANCDERMMIGSSAGL